MAQIRDIENLFIQVNGVTLLRDPGAIVDLGKDFPAIFKTFGKLSRSHVEYNSLTDAWMCRDYASFRKNLLKIHETSTEDLKDYRALVTKYQGTTAQLETEFTRLLAKLRERMSGLEAELASSRQENLYLRDWIKELEMTNVAQQIELDSLKSS